MLNRPLYELTHEYQALLDVEASLESAEAQAALGKLEGEIAVKCENIGKLILNLDSRNEAINQEVMRLRGMQAVMTNRKEWLRSYLLQQMEACGIKKAESAIVTVAVKTNPASVEIVDESQVPAEFKVQPPPTVSKSKILDTFKTTGWIVPGVKIVTDKKRVDIR